jgi:predicted transcriptional regulator
LALKDFTSVLSMHRDKRAELLAALREIFDGSWPRHVGTDGGRTLEWSGKLGLVAACTAAIDTHHAVMATMGERFLLYRLPHIDPAKQAARALDNAGREGVMRKELAAAVEGLFAGLDIRGKGLPPIDKDEKARLVALSSLVASARSAVERNPYGAREIDLIPDTEAPARLAQTLCRLYAGMLAIGLDRTTAWPLVVKTGLDCVPKLRRAVFEVLLTAEDWLTTKTVATRILHPTMTARRSLEDLNAHGVADRRPAEKGKGDGKSDMWRMSDLTRTRHKMIVTEKSPPECSDPPSTYPPSSIYTPPQIQEDIPVTTEKTASECGFEGGFDVAETPVETPDRHCWACKEEVGDADRCPSCGWMICACGSCSPECTEEGGV